MRLDPGAASLLIGPGGAGAVAVFGSPIRAECLGRRDVGITQIPWRAWHDEQPASPAHGGASIDRSLDLYASPRSIELAADKAGMERIGVHTLRHSAAVAWLASAVNVPPICLPSMETVNVASPLASLVPSPLA